MELKPEIHPSIAYSRQELIRAQLCFAHLSQVELDDLSALMQEEDFNSGEVIVSEGSLIDKIYIIISGKAEVSHHVVKTSNLKKDTNYDVPIAMISQGDAIGLNESGFYSTTGHRTATVTAITVVHALSLDLKKLNQYIENHPHVLTCLQTATLQMLRMQLIKQSLPFVHLSDKRTQWLAQQVETLQVKAGAVIFKQGDEGDSCYLIRTGAVEIVIQDEKEERRLALLKPPALFGEATMITHSPRNATARALEDTELLVLKHLHLSELIESEVNVTNMFMTLMIDRSRPLQKQNVSVHERKTIDGQRIIILKNHETGSYFNLSAEGFYIWQQLDGKKTMHDITMGLSNEFNIFAPNIVAGLLSKLAKAGFLANLTVKDTSEHKLPKWLLYITKLKKIFDVQYAFGDADKWLTQVYDKGAYLLFSTWSKILLAVIAIAGFGAFIASTNSTIETFNILPNVWWIFVWLVPFTLLSVALHELGHAFAAKSFGHEIHYIGIGWFWLRPVAFTDTSDMWLSPRGPRTVVNLAGVYADVLVAGVCSLSILILDNPYIEAFLWFFSLYTYITAFRMLSPLQELDGYYVLMDWLDKPHLRQNAVHWLVKKFPLALRQPKLFRRNKAEVYYWLACIVFIILLSLLTFFVQTVVMKMLGLNITSPYLALTLPLLMAIFSSLNVIADIKRQSGEN